MKVSVAEQAGFCFGVKRALEMANKAALDNKPTIYTLGPLIHNPQVVNKLEKEGIKAIDTLDQINEGTLIIRSHGVSAAIIEEATAKGLNIIDATCPFVKQAQDLAKTLNNEGYQVIVVGDRNHPEVMGIDGWTGNKAIIVENPDEAKKLPHLDKVGIVAQTTQPKENFEAVIDVLTEITNEIKQYNTICHATRERQECAEQLAKVVDVMIVVGGTNSANTMKLARICQQTGTPTYHVETALEIDNHWFDRKQTVGITAGASTPQWIIEEVYNKMTEINNDEQNFDMNQALQVKGIRNGDIITGIVVQINDDEALVDVGGKTEGVIPLRELSCCNNINPLDVLKEGEQLQLFVIKTEDNEGRMILSKRKADAQKAWVNLSEDFKNKTPIEGLVTEVVKGGILLDIGVQAFMPASQIERGYVENLNVYVGQKLAGQIIDLNPEKNKVVLSRKVIFKVADKEKQKELWQQIKEGEIIKGTVKSLTNYGAFIDIGGLEGLLHISEMAWYRVNSPAEILKVGDQVEVMILHIDKEKEKISLGMKQISPNPWSMAAERFPVGTFTKGRVVRIAPFGAFVELAPAIEGLVHLSQLSDQRVNKTEDVVKIGQEVEVKVISVNKPEGKIGLSIKEASQDKEKQELDNYIEHQNERNITLGDVFGDLFKDKKPTE